MNHNSRDLKAASTRGRALLGDQILLAAIVLSALGAAVMGFAYYEPMLAVVAAVLLAGLIGEVTAASSEQSNGVGQVNTTVSQLDQMTQQNAALVEESAAAAATLREQVAHLTRAVRVFKPAQA